MGVADKVIPRVLRPRKLPARMRIAATPCTGGTVRIRCIHSRLFRHATHAKRPVSPVGLLLPSRLGTYRASCPAVGPLTMTEIFISYARDDQAIAQTLAGDLK